MTRLERIIWEEMKNPDTITALGNRVGDLPTVNCKDTGHSWKTEPCPHCGNQHEHSQLEGPRIAHCHRGEYYLVIGEFKKDIHLSDRFRIIKRDGFKCRACGRGLEDGIKLEIDHIIPKSKGGSSDPDNLQTLCFDCNRGKSDD